MTIKASLVSLQGCTVNNIDRKLRHKHTDRQSQRHTTQQCTDVVVLLPDTATEMEAAAAFPPIWVMILLDPWVSHPVSPSRPYTSPQFPPHSTTLSSNLLLQPWQLKHMFSSHPELKLGDGERDEKVINEGRRESRGGIGSRGEQCFFMVSFNYKQPAWWGGYGHSTFRGILKRTPVPGEKRF